MRVLRTIVIVLAFVVVLAVFAGIHLLGREEIPTDSDYAIDRARLQQMARSIPGPRPVRVNHHAIAMASLPRAGVFAGESFDPHRMVHGVYQIEFPDGFLLIDAGFTEAFFEEGMATEDSRYDGAAFQAVVDAFGEARTVVLTHEHGDHIEGLSAVEDVAGFAPRLVMNAAQHGNPQTADVLPASLLDAVEPIPSDIPFAVAPGVVLLPAAGHTPGSQIIYVLTEDEREYLFVGDVAWHMDALRNLHYRPRLVTDFFLGEDRAAVMDQFRTLHGLLSDDTIHIVVSHDAEQRIALIREGLLGDGLQ